MAIVAVAVMAGGCTSYDGTQQAELVPIRLAACVEGSTTSHTRANTGSTTQDKEFLAGQTVDAYIKVKDGDWMTGLDATTPRHFEVTGTSGDLVLTTGETQDYYPMDATPVTIYAVHPSYTSAATFTVSDTQTDADNYAASDLCYSKTKDYNRTESKQELKFKHVLSKIIVHVDVGGLTGSHTVSNLRLWANTQTSLTYPVDNTDGYTLGTASTPAYIAMLEGAAAIIPPQTTSASNKVRILFDVSDYGPVAYDFPASTSFASNTQYEFTVTVGDYGITVSTSIQDWTSVNDASIQFIPPVDIKKNPLWYVSEKNVNYDGANYSFAINDNEGYFFSWNDAVKNFTTTANAPLATPNTITSYTLGSGSKIEGWHLPTLNEWNSIVPGATTSDTQLNIWNIVASDGSGCAFSETGKTVNVCFGYNNETRGTMTEKSYWYRKSNTELYAIRYCESDYCSAWKYEFTANSANKADPSVLTVSCTLLDASLTVAEAESEFGTDDAKWGAVTFDNDEAAGAVQRVFLARGHADNSASGPNGQSDGTNGSFWSSTLVSTNANAAWDMGLLLGNVGVFYLNNGNGFGRNVRLFRDRSDYPTTKAKTTIPLATTSNIAVGDIVCSDGSIYAAANAADVATEGKTPIGIIAYVNNEGDAGATTDIGNATTEKGKGRYDVKSLGRALVLCAMNIGGTANNATVGTLYQAGPRYGTLVQEGDNNLATSLYYWGFERTQGMNSATYPAAQAAYNFSTLTAPDCTTGWFLPSAGQWKKILNYVGGIGVADNKPLIHTWYSPLSDYASNINTKLDYLTAAGATIVNTIPLVEHHYWSSTNYSSTTTDNTYNGVVCNPSSGIAIGGYWGTESYYVRPVLAF